MLYSKLEYRFNLRIYSHRKFEVSEPDDCPWLSKKLSLFLNLMIVSCKINKIVEVSGRIEPMVELIHCSHRMIYTNQTICWDPIETERSEATIPRRSRGDAKRQTPRLTAWSLWPVVQKDLVPYFFYLVIPLKATRSHDSVQYNQNAPENVIKLSIIKLIMHCTCKMIGEINISIPILSYS